MSSSGAWRSCPAQREPLHHPARVVGHALAASLPEAEPLEQHSDALPPLRDPVQAAEQLEVLQRRELAVQQRLVREVAETGALGGHVERAARRRRQTRQEPEQSRLTRAVRAGDDQAAATLDHEREVAEHPA